MDLDILFVFIDDYSRYSWIFPMKSRSEMLPIYNNFAKMVETQFSKHIKTFRYDNALEYTQYAFQALLHSYGTVHHLTCLGTSQQNGRAERKLRHILDPIRAFLLSAKVTAPFWGEAALNTVHAINRIPSAIIHNQTPYKHLFGLPLTTITFAPLDLLVSLFFNLMNTTNLSIDLDFVVSLVMAKLKKGIGVMILSLIVFVFLITLSFGNTDCLLNSLTSVLP